jgi:predicted nucleotidyltransferase component of viral defense system
VIDSAKSLGFGDEAEARDHCQIQFLAQLMRQGADRFVLKGGMAMRALYGSARLTKDIDFDVEDSVSAQSMRTQMPKGLLMAARGSGLNAAHVTQTKAGDRASKWRLDARLGDGGPVSFDVEVSRRGVPGTNYVTTATVQAPYEYRIARFVVRVYTEAAMAAGKVNALLSENRNVPRDVYDIHDLVQHGADPSPLWIAHLSREALQRKRDTVWGKVDHIKFAQASAELLPYIAPALRETIDETRWNDICAEVAAAVDRWLETAIVRAKPAALIGHDPERDADLAGR